MAATVLVPPGIPYNPTTAIQYGTLAQLAYAIAPNQAAYPAGTRLSVTYGSVLNVNYMVVAPVYGNDLATDANPERQNRIVSFGFVAQDDAGNAVVSIRGTEGILEWVQDARFLTVKCPFLAGAGETEDGFTCVYESLRTGNDPAAKPLVDALPTAFPRPVTSLTICGHSLGASLATLLAMDVAANTGMGKLLTSITFASPRTGNPSFADTYNQVVPNTLRIANRLDIVPKLPLPPLYEHVGHEVDLNPGLSVRLDLVCLHSIDTYLHLISKDAGGPVLPLNQGCAGL